MLKRRRVMATLAAGAIAIGSLTACSSTTQSSSGTTEITFAYLWTAEGAKTIESMIAKYNASQSAIKVVGVPTDTTKQLAAMSASKGTFDVSDEFGSDVKSWAEKGILAPLDGLLAEQGVDTGDFVPAAMSQMKYEGAIYSMPVLVHNLQLIYNQDELSSADVRVPSTLSELYDANDALSSVSKSGKIERLGWGFSSEYESMLLLGWANGGEWDTDAGPTPTDPKVVEALTQFQERYVDKYGADNLATFRSGFGDYLSDKDPFYTGKLEMILDGEWHASTAPTHAPKLNWGVSGVPVAQSSLAGTTYMYSSTLFIPTNSTHQKEAAAFIAWMLQPTQMVELSVAMVNLPSRLSVLDDSAFAELKNFTPFLQALNSDHLKTFGGKTYSAEYQADLQAAFSEILLGTKTAKQALADVADRAASYGK